MPQTVLQIAMFYEGILLGRRLYASLLTSMITLIYSLAKLYFDAKYHGMGFASYVMSVMQLGLFCIVLFCIVLFVFLSFFVLCFFL